MTMSTQLKTIAIGDGAVGKTCMFLTFHYNEFPEEYIPTVFDNTEHEMVVDDNSITLALWDTAGGEDYSRLRPLSYPNTDVFLLCYDISSQYSMDNAQSNWAPELKQHCPDVPVILVGTKIDLRGDDGCTTATAEEGETIAEKIGATKYMEISSKRKEGLNELFDEVARIGYEYHFSTKKKSRKSKTKMLLDTIMPSPNNCFCANSTTKDPEINGIKTIVVGDENVGKTALLITYVCTEFPDEYIPTVFDNYSYQITRKGIHFSLGLWDTAGAEDYDRLRPLSYPCTDVIVLCFDISCQSTMDRVQSRWVPELKNCCPDIPVILVATKTDLRDEVGHTTVTTEEGKSLATTIGAVKYMEVSAKKKEGLNELFGEVAKIAYKSQLLSKKKFKKTKPVLLENTPDQPTQLKTIAVGDGGVGKTSMYITFVDDEFPNEYIPVNFDNYNYEGEFNGNPILMGLWDTGGGEDYDRLRPLCYPNTDVFMLCYDISIEGSMDRAQSYWAPELKQHCPDVPVILVGTKIDLRDDDKYKTATVEKGESIAKKIRATKYMEISSKRKEGLNELFEEVVRTAYEHHFSSKNKSKKCKNKPVLLENTPDQDIELKTVAVGDGGVGKTSMFMTFVHNDFPIEYIPTVFDNYPTKMEMDGNNILLGLWDTFGGVDYSRLRPLNYPNTDVFLLCYDISCSQYSIDQIQSFWAPELKQHCPDVPVILVGTKIDLRDDDGCTTATAEEGETIAEKIGATKYMEISSKRKEGLNELFEEVARIGYDHHQSKLQKKKCNIL